MRSGGLFLIVMIVPLFVVMLVMAPIVIRTQAFVNAVGTLDTRIYRLTIQSMRDATNLRQYARPMPCLPWPD